MRLKKNLMRASNHLAISDVSRSWLCYLAFMLARVTASVPACGLSFGQQVPVRMKSWWWEVGMSVGAQAHQAHLATDVFLRADGTTGIYTVMQWGAWWFRGWLAGEGSGGHQDERLPSIWIAPEFRRRHSGKKTFERRLHSKNITPTTETWDLSDVSISVKQCRWSDVETQLLRPANFTVSWQTVSRG